MWRFIIFCYLNLILLSEVKCARILGVYPIPSKSHQFVFQSYNKALAKRGHELVIISPDPFPNDTRPENVTDIDVSFSYEFMVKILKQNKNNPLKRGVINDIDVVIETALHLNLVKVVVDQLNYPTVRNFMNDNSQKFDLIVVEGFYEYQLILSHIFKAPVIMFPSFMGFPEHFEMLGGIARHPILYPHLQRKNFDNLNLFQWAKELYYEYKMFNMMWELDKVQNNLLKENFGPDAPTVNELKQNVDMLFLNSYAMFGNNRPLPPNIIYLGAVQLQPRKEIPKDLRTYLDNSKRGVIYVSFGSNILPTRMSKDLLVSILQAFEELPYDILWKFDGESLENMPKNVRYQKWFPQRDLLFHPNIKVFVTQCGLQSTDEAIDAGVPLVGIPMMAEQGYNAQKYVDFGIGVKLDAVTFTTADLVRGVKTVAENKSYRENVVRLKKILQDETQTPLERAVWWTEYVIRHSGARHLRNPGAGMPWHKYYMLDIVLPLLGIFFTALTLAVILIWCAFKSIVRLFRSDKLKTN